MIDTLKQEVKKQQLEAIFKSKEYIQLLKELASNIKKGAESSPNEATTVSYFEMELFNFFKETFASFGYRYYPTKETGVDTERHVAKGKMDTHIGALVIEYKHHSKLSNEKYVEKATNQVIEYIEGLYKKEKMDYLGIVTDGIRIRFVRLENGSIIKEALEPINEQHLDRLIKSIILLEVTALTPKNLVNDFCSSQGNNISLKLAIELYNLIKNKPTTKTQMLFNEWKELFKLAHDDESKQQAIQERRKALENVVGEKFTTNDEEYMMLFSLQTAYAIIVKIIAYKVISKIRYNANFIDFKSLAGTDSDTLRIQLNALEEGAIFRSVGIDNLLEGDFFSWYCADDQWSDRVADVVKTIFAVLTKYEDKAVLKTGENVQDLFKDLYIKMMPEKVRHSLGEYYTPAWLAENVVLEAIDLINNSEWKGLDPCAGSGTFITVMIGMVLKETVQKSKTERLRDVLERVKAVDLNPLAVLTARINYFINICHLIEEEDVFEIPVYLGDASYVPGEVEFDGVKCLKYTIKTLEQPIDILIPKSALSNHTAFSKIMTEAEYRIKNQDIEAVCQSIVGIVDPLERTDGVIQKIRELSETLVELERRNWDGIWARIITNFLTTANLGKFDIVVGNPPWIDWKNLPKNYRERIKSICIARHLFSGDKITGGINLNICALIANVSAQNWLKSDGVLAFLMPQTLIFQQSYEGFRNFWLDMDERLYFQKFTDWTEAGHPFHPVQQKFLTFFVKRDYKDYSEGVETTFYKLKPKTNLRDVAELIKADNIGEYFDTETIVVGQCNKANTIFTYADSKQELEKFKKISGQCSYVGREGIEFYPQELLLLKQAQGMPVSKDKIYLTNYQNDKSKYKIIFPGPILLEKEFLHPLVKGTNIERFRITTPEFIVPFPYEGTSPKIPIKLNELYNRSKELARFYSTYKSVFMSQTKYSERIIGNDDAEFYALARVGKYSFAENYVAFRDNTKWQSAVVSQIETTWGGLRRPLLQNHAASICESQKGRFITHDEAHYICAILNAPITTKFILNSSDSRSFKIRPPINLPEYDENNEVHKRLSELSKEAHKSYNNKEIMKEIDNELDKLYISLSN